MERTIPKLIDKEDWPNLENNMRIGTIFEARCDVEALAYAYVEREKMLLKVVTRNEKYVRYRCRCS